MSDQTPKNEEKKPPVIRAKSTNGGGLPHPKVPDASGTAPRDEKGAAPPRVNLKKKSKGVPDSSDETARISMPGPAGADATERIDIPAALPDSDTERIQISAAKAEGKAETGRADQSARLSQTDRIDLSAAKKPGETARIDVGATGTPKDTDRIDLAAAKPISDTARISAVPESAAPHAADEDDEEFTAVTLDPEMLKKAAEKAPRPSTDRIDLAETMPMDNIDAPEPVQGEVPIEKPAAKEYEELMAASTVPIESLSSKDLMAAETLPIEAVLGEDASDEARAQGAVLMNQTMRVELDPDEVAKGETARIDAPRKPAASAEPGTSRVELSAGTTNGEDVLRRAAKGTAAAAAGAAARKSAPPPPMPTPTEEEEVGIISPPTRAKPGTARIEVEPPTKSATARIEVDATEIPHAPPRPKSIKLKRAGAEGAARKPDQPAAAVTPAAGISKASAPDSLGPLVGAAALATVLVMAVLIYVLAAQTLATNLPFPGRM